MAQQGLPDSTEEKVPSAGRANGFLREFGPTSNIPNHDGFDFLGSTLLTRSTIRPPYRGG